MQCEGGDRPGSRLLGALAGRVRRVDYRARALGGLDQLAVGLRSGPGLPTHREAPAVLLREQHVVHDRACAGLREVVDQGRVHEPGPGPSANQGLRSSGCWCHRSSPGPCRGGRARDWPSSAPADRRPSVPPSRRTGPGPAARPPRTPSRRAPRRPGACEANATFHVCQSLLIPPFPRADARIPRAGARSSPPRGAAGGRHRPEQRCRTHLTCA